MLSSKVSNLKKGCLSASKTLGTCVFHCYCVKGIRHGQHQAVLIIIRMVSHVLITIILAGDTVKIGEISYKLKTPQNPELVPVKHSM